MTDWQVIQIGGTVGLLITGEYLLALIYCITVGILPSTTYAGYYFMIMVAFDLFKKMRKIK